jgi:hypothetical protein
MISLAGISSEGRWEMDNCYTAKLLWYVKKEICLLSFYYIDIGMTTTSEKIC